MNDELRRGRSVVFSLSYHLVFITKYRKNAIGTERVRECLRQAFASVCNDFGGVLRECDGEDDHVHLLVDMPPKIAPSIMVNSLKGVSARMLRAANYPEVRKKLWGEHFWSPSYFVASTGGVTLDKVRAYIQNQRQGGDSSQP
jgi:putative transposase